MKVRAHKQNSFSRSAQNQDAVNFYNMGFFDPAKASQSLACMELLDMENKEKIRSLLISNARDFERSEALRSMQNTPSVKI